MTVKQLAFKPLVLMLFKTEKITIVINILTNNNA